MSDITVDSTSRTVTTENWKLHYHEAGAGHPVILLHGSGPGATGWSNFSQNIPALAERLHVYAVDMPGWGQSSPATHETLDHVATLREFLDALGIEKAALVGNSMGGATSMAAAIQYPDRVSHLITMGAGHARATTLFGAGDGPSEGLKILFEAYRDPSPASMRRLVEIMTFDKERFATDELTAARAEAAQARPEHLQNIVDGLPYGSPIPRWFALDDLQHVQAPTLLIHGRDDRVVPPEFSLHFLARIPNSRLVLINRCGHWTMIEHAEEFNRLVLDFVENN